MCVVTGEAGKDGKGGEAQDLSGGNSLGPVSQECQRRGKGQCMGRSSLDRKGLTKMEFLVSKNT